jgi:esterase/lipase superfamily enzyme
MSNRFPPVPCALVMIVMGATLALFGCQGLSPHPPVTATAPPEAGAVKKAEPPPPAAEAPPLRPPVMPEAPPPAMVAPRMRDGGAEESSLYATVRIFYGTDRKATGRARPKGFYGNERSDMALGFCDVSIPRDHRLGELEKPSILKLEFREDPAKHVVLLGVQPLSVDEFYSKLQAGVGASRDKEAFVFVHGFNVTFEDAARRTAQMAYDLGFDGAPILYSWPSQGKLAGYMIDETNVEWTVPHLKNFLTEIVSRSGARTVHLIAHSMGNRALTNALKEIALDQQRRESLPMFREVVLAAPDIDADVFKALAGEIKAAAGRLTLYASSKDAALIVSKGFHGYPRAGDSGGEIVVLPGVDTIDVSAVDTGLLGHSYYGDNTSVLSDLFHLLKEDKPPDQRFGMTAEQNGDGRYWIFNPQHIRP